MNLIRGLVLVGVATIIIGIILLFIGLALQSAGKSQGNEDTTKVKAGGVVLIGPIPIIFGTDKGLTLTVVILAIVLMVVSYLLFYRGSL